MKLAATVRAFTFAFVGSLVNAADGLTAVKSPNKRHDAASCPVAQNLKKALSGLAEVATAK